MQYLVHYNRFVYLVGIHEDDGMISDYSNTKIDTFKQCRCKYKLQYIDGVKIDRTKSIETFMGSRVHETLEKLYRDKTFCKNDTLDELMEYYDRIWDENYDDSVTVAKKEYTADNYREMGRKCIIDYYRSHEPFEEMKIIGLETDDVLILPNGKKYSIRIDKLGCRGSDYYVCDYKTNQKMKTKDEADTDRQLAMYAVWVRKKFPDAAKVHLVWHMLRFDKDVTSERTDEELSKLTDQIVGDIEEIESCTDWSPNVTVLCDYCEFKKHCPEFRHETIIENTEPEKLTEDEAYAAVNEYAEVEKELSELNKRKKELDERKKELSGKISDYANANGLTAVYGDTIKCSVSRSDNVSIIESKKGDLKNHLIKEGISEYLMLSTAAIQSAVRKNGADDLFMDYVEISEDYKVSSSKREKPKRKS